jgi:hypothetical protein
VSATSESYVPVSRGLRDHLPTMSSNAVKLYVDLLLTAAFTGPTKGQVAASFAELGLRLRMHKQTVHEAARTLRPYFIDWQAAKNQHGITVFTIQKYKSIKDFAVSRRAHSSLTAPGVPYEKIDQHLDSTLTAPSATDTKDNRLSAPKKLKKLKKEAAAANSVWEVLGIAPCGPPGFRTLLESGWSSRNREPVSILIGNAVDAWEVADGKRPRIPQLFQALARLRAKERQEKQTPVITQEPIHMLTPEEIPA